MKKVLVGGRFNILHPGHIDFLEKAKSLGDYLVVVIARDSTILKNKNMLLFPEEDRKRMIESIRFVDKVVVGFEIGREEDYFDVVEKERPDIIALGPDQKISEHILKRKIKESGMTCEVMRVRKKFKNYSTTDILKKINKE